jgi:dTDP-4-amino-4,6-dideoxygalactose transaminase
MDAIQLFVPSFRIEECLAEIRECLEKGWTGIGFKTITFEDAWKNYTDLPHAHFLNSATSGLHLAMRLLKERHGWSDGDEVISTPLTFVSTNHAILYENLKPVFADVDDYLCLDPESVRERITERTRAIVFVGLGGNTGQLQAIVEIAQEFGLKLILDASHMAGTRFHGKHVGYESDVAVFSFQAVKNLPTADSGMICFADPELDADARKWTWLGINKDTFTRTASQGAYKWHYDVEHPGFKYHGNSVMAGIGLVSLKYVDQDNAFRRQIAAWYEANLSNIPGIEIVPTAPGCESSRHLFQVLVDYRDEVMASLNTMNIFPGVHYRDNTLYGMFSNSQPCPNARQASLRLVSLPMHLRLSYNDVLRVSQSFVDVIGQMSRYHRGGQVA